MLNFHMSQIRKKSIYRDALIVVFIESNNSWISADGIANELTKSAYQPIVCDSHDPKNQGRVGVWTDNDAKRVYAEDLKRLLTAGKLYFADATQFIPCHSRDPAKAKYGVLPNVQMNKMFEQLGRFRRIVKPAKDAFGKDVVIYTGKDGSKNDDVLLSNQIAISNAARLKKKHSFQQMCRHRGFHLP